MADRAQAAAGTCRARLGVVAVVALSVAACAPSDVTGTPLVRAGRFGSLRDFVLMELPPAIAGGPPRILFVDRFEVTRGDWVEFVASKAGAEVDAELATTDGDPALPVGCVSLIQARAFAHWRFARLPDRDEWMAAVKGGGTIRYPWGNKVDATCANTGELGLGQPTLVGTFESGRRLQDQPYDFVGNVSEWTETVPNSWFEFEDPDHPLSLPIPFATGRLDVLRAAGLSIWQPVPGLAPPLAVVMARSAETEREVVGANFQSNMENLIENVPAGDRRLRTGARLFTTPVELLRAMILADVWPGSSDQEQLRRFLARSGHLRVLRAAWPAAIRGLTRQELDRPLASWLRQRLEV
ncbi:MAG: SUMF1/EgtB/PvdO family nonheme iron enzyme [Planctomycetes bacterium]|nr:SUMF1/EgtB/PvdO family nonheme iron enzyme [Planctomycetota bacterium]